MYTMITTMCNMSCAHCCFSCGSDGEHMPFEMFKEIIDRYAIICTDKNRYIALGGGEPTIHPEFWKFLGYVQSHGLPWLATNGKKTDTSLALCRMAKKGLIGCALSLDEWHEKIDAEVIESFTTDMIGYDHIYYVSMFAKDKCADRREVRMAKIAYNAGRAELLPETEDICCCHGIQFRVNGDIYPCGCEDAPKIGDYKTGIINSDFKYYDTFDGCYKEINKMWSADV